MRKLVRENEFLVGVLTALTMAILWADGGRDGGVLRGDILSDAAVVTIFFLQGVSLATESLWQGLLKWRVHVFVQLTIFGAIPLIMWGIMALVGDFFSESLRLGFLYLSILPCTISSAVVYTHRMGGDASVALFNVTVANIAGVFIVPVWMTYVMQKGGLNVPLGPLLGHIALTLLLPLFVGQLLRKILLRYAHAARWPVGRINTALVFVILYFSFCNAVHERFWESVTFWEMALAVTLAAGYYFIATFIAVGGGKLLKLPHADAVAAAFCGSHKTTAAGVPMAKAIFSTAPGVHLGLALLPLLIYAPVQLSLGGIAISRREKRLRTEGRIPSA